MKSYYDILGVPQDAPLSEIKRIHRKLIKVWHPDRFTDLDDKQFAEEKLKEINEAYEVLENEDKRRRYDEKQREKYEKEYGPTVQKPKLVVSTKIIDFGEVKQGKTPSQIFLIDNQGGPGKNLSIQFVPEDSENFFKWEIIPNSKEVGKEFPIKFEITLDTQRLELDQSYEWKIIVSLDGEKVEVIVLIRNIVEDVSQFSSLKIDPTLVSILPTATPPIIHRVNVLKWKGSKFLLWLGTIGPIIIHISILIGVKNYLSDSSSIMFAGIIGLIPILSLSIGLRDIIITKNLKFPEKLGSIGNQIQAVFVMYIGVDLVLAGLFTGITMLIFLIVKSY